MTSLRRPPASSQAVEDTRTGSGTLPRGLGPVRFSRRPEQVEAVQVSIEGLDAIAAWCHGHTWAGTVMVDTRRGPTQARPGAWIVKCQHGHEVYDDYAEMFAHFEQVRP